ncbi:hypothetical protein P280DRAFT_474336 [Massarina eburnea CBS 473.64]|uniref:RBR-type E3 ubiquitin transferase n=1 Tax=Massarina eburnea CBS 473.64 TaxID=1395130 RepID=A0A6A6RIQ1_9PLEO|nr:hypothetical protein P280DRAFT_474336 [Massarina eburnea CBS 473.64]
MGSKLSKIVRRPHGNAAASNIDATSLPHETLQTNTRQELRTCLPDTKSVPLVGDEVTAVAASSIAHDTTSHATQNDDNRMDTDQPRRPSSDLRAASLLEELQELPGAVTDHEPTPPPPPKTCLICTSGFENDEKPIKPCTRCHNDYCASCLKTMFLEACKDQSRMPPRCCNILPIHHVRPHLSKEEADIFRAKFEEWNTPKPFYCPVARCSAFIPNRLLPQMRTNGKGKQRVDSTIGTPSSPTVSCPQCETELCVGCRSLAHTGATCEPLEFGIDKKTAELLKKWGYKKCPKCGNGVKRMHGCNHMECRCGAHFCWGCLKSQELCIGDCYTDDEDSDTYSEPDNEETQEQDNSEEAGNTQSVPLAENGEAIPAEAVVSTTPAVPPPSRFQNLDGGSGRYWENQDLDFGDEPTDDFQDRTWDCDHSFSIHHTILADSLHNTAAENSMECMKCWGTVHPEISMPKNINRGASPIVPALGSLSGRRRGVRVRASIDRARRQYTAFQGNSQRETLSQSMISLPTDRMEDVNRVFDTHGTTVQTAPSQTRPKRRFSFDDSSDVDHNQHLFPFSFNHTHDDGPAPKTPRLSFSVLASKFSFAYHCKSCGILVCDACKEDLLAAVREKEEEALEREIQREEEEEEEWERERERERERENNNSEEVNIGENTEKLHVAGDDGKDKDMGL